MNAISNRDIIITGLQPWDITIGSNCKNIALEFSKNNRVLYVNSPLDFMTSFRERGNVRTRKRIDIVKGKAESLVRISENLWNFYPAINTFPVNQLKINSLFDIINKINNRRFSSQIKKAIDKLGFKNYILFNDSDMFRSYYLKEMLKPSVYVYYTRDNLLAVKYWQGQGFRIEPDIMSKADLIVSNSNYLARLASAYNKESHFVGQGCDISAFRSDRPLSAPDDIAAISTPIIGYIGALNTLRLDIDVIEHIALSRPEWNIVLVGPEDERFRNSRLHNISNIHFTGPKNENELPAYLNAFNVAINPQVLNEVTIGNYPRKIDEYLSMGKPCVATRTEAMEYFADHVSLAGSKEEWIAAVEQELQSDNIQKKEARINFAGEHTWENNVKEIYRFIDKVEKNGTEK
jgi:glycosyltransferase involved in cell wall biosynthesis